MIKGRMMSGRKKIIGALAAAMALTLAFGMALLPARETADAARSTTAWTNIGEIYDDKNDAFNADNLNKLYEALTGKTEATFADIKTAADGGNKTSANFRANNSGNNVSVWFGGFKWDAVYLTKDKSGNVILDLWQSADNMSTEVDFLGWDAERTDINDTYPANMYSTSKLRVDTLNAGGYCLISKDKLGAKQGQDNKNQYARFTMAGKDSNGKSSLINYIATPSEVGYQANEFDEDTAADINKQVHNEGKKYYLPNDAYDTPISGGEWFDAEYDNLYNDSRDDERWEEAKYGAWQNDYLWIPSITEAGCSAAGTGLWDTDVSIRSAGSEGEAFFWFRSGYCSDEPYSTHGYFFTFVMGVNDGASDHADWSNKTSDEPNFARPALHLNLSAANSSAEKKTVGEIYNDGSNGFNADNLKALYQALTGKETFTDIKTEAGTNKTSADFRAQSGQNVSVWFGGIKWDATYLTTAKNGDVILDLWQSVENVTLTSKWADRTSGSNNPTAPYPDSMYSTSLIRVKALNADGQYSTSGTALATAIGQDVNSPYARFTMSSAEKSLTAFLATPAQVGYQADEFDATLAKEKTDGRYLPNDAYGTPKAGGVWVDTFNYNGKDQYGAWQNDYLWLPSVTEAGCDDEYNGLWETEAFLRNSGVNFIWTRSGDDNWAGSVYAFDPTTTKHLNRNVPDEYLVRPALHLNLTAIHDAITETVTAKWTDGSSAQKTYYTTGGSLLDKIKADIQVAKADGTQLSAYTVSLKDVSDVTNAGEYTFTVTLTDPNYQFGRNGQMTTELSVKVEEAAARVTMHGTTTGYGSFADAWNAAEFGIMEGAGNITLTLYQNAPYSMNITVFAVYDPPNLTFDLNGHTLTLNSIAVSNGTFTLKDSSGGGTGKLIGNVMISKGATFTLQNGVTIAGDITVPTGANFKWGGGIADSVTLEKGAYIEVLKSYTAPKEKIKIKVKVEDVEKGEPFKVIDWTGIDASETDPFQYFGNEQLVGCLYEEAENRVAYIGQHVVAFDEIEWTEDFSSVTFTAKCRHCEYAKLGVELTESAGRIGSSVTNARTCTGTGIERYTATANWSDLIIFDVRNAQLASGLNFTVTKDKTLAATGHDWHYSWDGAQKAFVAECGNDWHATGADKDGDKKFTVTFTAPDGEVYNGAAQPVTYGATEAEPFKSGFTITYQYQENAGYVSIGEPINAGNYQAAVTANGDKSATKVTGNLTFTITRATITVSGTYTDGKSYDGTVYSKTITPSEAGLSVTSSVGVSTTAQVTITTSGKDYGEYKNDGSSPSASIVVSLADSTNFKCVCEVSVTIKINKAKLTFTLTNPTAEYTGSGHADVDVGFEGIQNNEAFEKDTHYTLTFAKADETAELDGALPKNAGEYTVTVTLLDERDTNYDLSSNTGTYTITRATLTVIKAEVAPKTYNGEFDDPEITFTFTGYKGSDNHKEAIDVAGYTAAYANANVGTVTVTVSEITLTGTAKDNYTVSLGKCSTTTGEITKRTIYGEITWTTEAPYTYKNGIFADPTAKATGVKGDLILAVEMTKNPSGEGKADFQNAGDYTFAAALQGDDAINYKFDENVKLDTVIHINKAPVKRPTADPTVFTYNGTEQTYNVQGGDSAHFAIKDGSNKRTDANEKGYTVTVALNDPSNYIWANTDEASDESIKDLTFLFIIHRKELTFTFHAPESLVYGSGGAFSVTFVGVVKNDDVKAVLKYSGTPNDSSSPFAGGTERMPTLAGKYEVALSLGGTRADNYKLKEGAATTQTFTIARAPVEKPTADPTVFTYNGEMQTYNVQGGDSAQFAIKDESNKRTDANEKGYTVTVALNDPDNYMWKGMDESSPESIKDLTFSFIIMRKTIDVTWTVGAYEYSGTEQIRPTAKAETGVKNDAEDFELAVVMGNFPAWGVYDKFIVAGNYTFTADFGAGDAARSGNYTLNAETITQKVTIAQKELTIAAKEHSVVYGEALTTDSGVTYNGFVDGEDEDDLGGKLTFRSDDYTQYVSGVGDSCHIVPQGYTSNNYRIEFVPGVLTVTPRGIKVNWAVESAYEYSGEEQNMPGASAEGVNGDAFTLDVEIDKTSPMQGEFLNAGEYRFVAKFKTTDTNSKNYTLTDEKTGADIAKAKLTVTAQNNTVTYGEAPAGNGVKYDGFKNKEDEGVLNIEGLGYDFTYPYSAAAIGDVGDYKITPKGLSADNYYFDYREGTLTVRAKEIEVTWGNESYTYTGSPLAFPTATATGVRGDGFTLVVSRHGFTGDFLNAGQYVFEAALNSMDAKAKNYILEETSTTHSYTVLKKPVAAPQIASKVYNGARQTADIEASALYSAENDGGTIVGDYPVKLTLTDSKNYKWTDSEAADILRTFSITKATYDMGGVTFAGYTVIYDGEAHSVKIEGALPQGVAVNYTGNAQTAVGEYTVTANFAGDGHNYFPIPSMAAVLTIVEVSEGLLGITFEDVTVKYDGEAHSIFIAGALRYGATVSYENNGQTEPNIYSVTALFHNPSGVVFAKKMATLTILRTYTQAESQEGGGSAEVTLDSAEGFDPTLELVVEKTEDISRKYLAWEEDVISEKYAVKMYRNGEEVPFGGKVTVRLLIPEEFRDKNFELMALTGARAQNVSYTQGDGSAFAAAEGLASVNFRRDGDYVVFEADGLSEYVFTVEGIPYMTILLTAAGIALAGVMTLIGLAIVVKKNKKGVK